MKSKYLLFYLKTWWWHISSAKALGKYLESEVDVVLVDWLKEVNSIVRAVMEDGYTKVQSNAKLVYELMYLCNKVDVVSKINQKLVSTFVDSYVKKVIEEEKPNKIIVFHFFLIKPIEKALNKLNLDIPVTVIVTDPFTATRSWFVGKNMKYIVYSERVKEYAIKLWLSDKNIKVYPVIIHEKFEKLPSKEDVWEIKKKLWIDIDKKIILVLGSWWGMPRGTEILNELKNVFNDVQLLVVCWRDKKMFAHANKLKKSNSNIFVYEFVDFIDNLIHVSDVVITKWWPASVLEILLCGKIPLIHDYLREQEKWNVEYVVDNGVGVYEKDIEKLVAKAQSILAGEIGEYQRNIKKLGLKIGTREVWEELKKWV